MKQRGRWVSIRYRYSTSGAGSSARAGDAGAAKTKNITSAAEPAHFHTEGDKFMELVIILVEFEFH